MREIEEMVRILKEMVKIVERNNASVISWYVNGKEIMIVAEFKGLSFEYGYCVNTKRLVVMFDNDVIEEMYTTF